MMRNNDIPNIGPIDGPLEEDPVQARKHDSDGVLFLGTGVSTGLPRLSCILTDQTPSCPVCFDGYSNPTGPNRRCNVSIVIIHRGFPLLIDCGKTTRESVLRWFPYHNISQIHSILLTHGHADAILGLDDVRDLQFKSSNGFLNSPINVFLNQQTYEWCSHVFPYLIPSFQQTMPNENTENNEVSNDVSFRRVSNIKWNVIENTQPIEIMDVPIHPIELFHGGNYISLGFIIGFPHNASRIIHLSDVSQIPESSMNIILSLGSIDLLIVDAINHKKHYSHFNLEQAIELARKLRAKKTRLVGIDCGMGLHSQVNAKLSQLYHSEHLDIQLARDGTFLPMNFHPQP
mmetsp:Transcript_12923/g.23245  ORF Transcript_12923/g.23245 Transcript_12923/m.23245 type:complete len:345 (-) Transcript_12923:1148-2182(-)